MAAIYATLDQLKSRFSISGTADDTMLERALNSASREIDKMCHRRFDRDESASARVYRTVNPCVVEVDDFSTATGLIVKTDEGGDGTYETTWAADDYELRPLNGVVDGESGWPYSELIAVDGRRFPTCFRRAAVQVTALWGWAAVPDEITEATLVLASELAKLKDAPFGVASFGDFGPIRVRENPIALRLIAPYRKAPVMVA